jgi:membrane-associated PAP2 superfamily phosphatase
MSRALARWGDPHLLWALALAPMLALLFEATPVDRVLIGMYFDTSSHSFPLRDDLFLQGVMHSGMKLLVTGIAFTVFGAFLMTWLLPEWITHRRRLLWVTLGMAGGSLLVSLLKHGSAQHCPWDLAAFGGYAPFHGLFDRLPTGTAPGRCFPGGHASGGFALLAFYFGLKDSHRRAAFAFLAAGFASGMAMGWAQMMRGAHFLSHNAWAGWVVWMYLAVLHAVFPPVSPPECRSSLVV